MPDKDCVITHYCVITHFLFKSERYLKFDVETSVDSTPRNYYNTEQVINTYVPAKVYLNPQKYRQMHYSDLKMSYDLEHSNFPLQ